MSIIEIILLLQTIYMMNGMHVPVNVMSIEPTTTESIVYEETMSEIVPESPVIESTDLLAGYSDLAIEYARIWIQLGPNPDIDTLNVNVIQAGTPINPYAPDGAVYPETVTQLRGNRNLDGIVTYSSNHDGTINVYSRIPHHFEDPTVLGKSQEMLIADSYWLLEEVSIQYIDVSTPELVQYYADRLYIY